MHEDRPGNYFTIVERLRTEASFSQAACINKLEHLITDEENSALSQWENKQAFSHLRCVNLIKHIKRTECSKQNSCHITRSLGDCNDEVWDVT